MFHTIATLPFPAGQQKQFADDDSPIASSLMLKTLQNTRPQPLLASKPEPADSLQPSSSAYGLPIELRPRGQLRSFVYTHKVAGHDCWTFISDGLAAIGQKEIVITVRREQNAPRPESPLKWFEVLYTLVQTGKVVNDFDVITFSNFQFLGRSDFTSFVHTNPVPLENLPSKALPKKYLQATVLTKLEADVVRRYGPLRFLSHLGNSVRYFPYPPWIDAERKTVISMSDFSKSLLNFCPCIDVRGFQAVKIGEDVHAYLSSKATQVLARGLEQLGPESPFVLSCGLLEDADSCFVWKNDQSAPAAIGTSLNRTSLCFLCFCPVRESEFLLEMREDGYFLILSHSDFQRVRNSILTRQPITLLTKAGYSFHLNMRQDMYLDHAKNRVYVVPCTE